MEKDMMMSIDPVRLGLIPADSRKRGLYQSKSEKFYSPFREERTPSFNISPSRRHAGWDWYDFGSHEGGTVISLVSRLRGISEAEAWDYIWEEVLQNGQSLDVAPVMRTAAPARNVIEINRIEDFSSSNLLSYAAGRGIPEEILKRYCRQVTFHFSNNPRRTDKAIGFPNVKGGWVLRLGRNDVQYCKSNVGPGAPTFIGVHGDLTQEPTHREVKVFEGFFDFLSWLVLADKTLPFRDICILNSTANTDAAMDFILSHQSINCCLDNDQTGKEATQRIRMAAEVTGRRFYDSSVALGELNDVNEFLNVKLNAKNNNQLKIK